ncbi:MAG TPA: hypothetical protein VHM90_15310, partial [Phycisphaerae bacterium]|nr:hypothetical protein [Phycisphaerae bacterium]
YAAGPAPQLTGSGTPVAGKARELARWNGRRIFLFDSGDKGWTDAAARIEGSLKATSGPLVAALVVDKADGKDNLQFELRNRSEQEVKVCSTPWPGGGHDVGFGVYQIDFFPAVTLSDNPPPEWWRTRVVTLKPGESLHWPVNYPPMTPGSHLKLDACYGTLFDASEIGIWDGSAIAPTVDVRVDETGRVTIAPWKPAVISPEVSAVSQRVGTQMQCWVGDLDQELKSVADGIYPQIFADPDSKAEVTDLSCVVQLNTRWGASDSPRQFTGDLPQLTLRVSAMRLGEWNDLALATESAQAKWDGNAIFRQYRLPGSTWVISLAAQANNPALAQKANDVLDAAYDKLAKIAADAAQESPANPTLQEPSATAFEHPESLAGQALKAAGIIESRGPAKVHANEEDGVVGHFWEVAENAPERRWLNVWADAQGVIVEANYAAQPGYCAGRDLQAMAERLPKEAGGTWQMEPINVLPVTQPILRGQESTEPGKVQAGYDVFPFGLDRFESSLGASYKSANPAAIHILGSARFITVLEGRDLSKAEPASTVKLVKALGLHRIAEIEAKQSDIVPDGGVPYLLPGGAIYKEGGTGPAEADTSAAWERANEFVFRTALRKAYKLPGLDARDTGDTRGYVVHFTALDSGAPLQVEVAQDLKLVRLPRAPAPPAAATRP